MNKSNVGARHGNQITFGYFSLNNELRIGCIMTLLSNISSRIED